MALEDITDKITSDSSEKTREIISQAENDVAKIELDTKMEIDFIEKEASLRLEKTLTENESRIIASAKQESKRTLDNTKRELLDEAFDVAFNELVNLSEKDYTHYVEQLARELPPTFEGSILTSEKRSKETAAGLKKAGFTKNISPVGTFSGGFVAIEDTFEYNATFEKLFADKKSGLETEVAHILFGNTSK